MRVPCLLPRLASLLAVVSFLTLGAAPAGATLFQLTASLDGAQEVPPVPTPATGHASVTYDDVSGLLSWTIVFSGLVGTTTDAHFHGPGAPGVSAGIRVPIAHTDGLTADTLIGSATISPAFGAELLADLWYINIHSTFRPGGEIRGQVVPEPATLLLLGTGVAFLSMRRRARG
jgi:CHRD domain/PEP-CTERM motif